MRVQALVVCLALGGCATMTSGNISERAAQIQQYTRLFCSFVPTVATVATLISKSAEAPSKLAQDICNAVTTAPLADGPRGRIKLHGVVIKGDFVR